MVANGQVLQLSEERKKKKMRIAVWGNIATQLNVLWEIAEFRVYGFEPGSGIIWWEKENLSCLKFEKLNQKRSRGTDWMIFFNDEEKEKRLNLSKEKYEALIVCGI